MDLETSRKAVLLIDDDRSLHQIEQYVLRQNGFELISAYSGDEGLKKALSERPDVILLDYMMPGLSGRDVLNKVQTDIEYSDIKSIPIVMLTAAIHDDQHIRDLLHQGLAAYLCKPFGKNELINVLNSVIHKQAEALEEKLLFEQLLHSRDFFHNILSNFPGLLITTDQLGLINYFSGGSSTFSSMEPGEVKGRTIWDLLQINEHEVFFFFHNHAEAEYFKKETCLLDQNGSEIPVAITLSHLKKNDGEVVGLLCIAHDLIAQHKFEAEKNEKEQIKGIVQAMATVNHEINNPLTPILGNLSLLISESANLPTDILVKLTRIQESAEIIREKVYKMSNISKPIFKSYYKDEMIIDIERSQ
ncbi:MAG: response regulator [Deferribacteres bacterium]|nr:response regulator [candidate division KSB1 bacterium]MCB9501955.1 response regulator [Deferribacteres bacterium]